MECSCDDCLADGRAEFHGLCAVCWAYLDDDERAAILDPTGCLRTVTERVRTIYSPPPSRFGIFVAALIGGAIGYGLAGAAHLIVTHWMQR